LNSKNVYDVNCGLMSISRGSRIMTRTCVPAFLADYAWAGRAAESYGSRFNSASERYFNASWYRGGFSSCSPAGSHAVPDVVHYEGNCVASGGPGGAGYSPSPQAAAAAMGRREEYADNVLQVINSDPLLREKATHLAKLYQEMKLVQGRYTEARKADRPNRDSSRRNLNPRTH
jgi:hypothetical protein